jgi:uncharacterized protein YcgL (UPF0745 family)
MLSVGSFFGRGFDSHRLHHLLYQSIRKTQTYRYNDTRERIDRDTEQ